MFPTARRAVVAVLALAMTMALTATTAFAEPVFRDKPRTTRPNPDVVLRGSGWGHGVGMSQYGAYAMAQAGRNYREILTYYYRGTVINDAKMPNGIRVGLHNSATASPITAVKGDVQWKACDGSDCVNAKKQSEDVTYTVRLLDDGRYQLSRGSTVMWRGGKGRTLRAAFNPDARAGGSIIEAFNPNGSRRRYKWGRMEYTARSAAAGTMFMVLDIPTMQHYLRGLGEVPSSWGAKGIASLKAQATAARTYALRYHRDYNGRRSDCLCSVLATAANQVYVGYDKETEAYGDYWVKAVDDTKGMVARYDGNLISTYYSSSHGGRSENIQDSWAYGTTPIPYLRSVGDEWSLKADTGNGLASWKKQVSNESFANFLRTDIRKVRRIKIASDRTDGGTPRTLRVRGLNSDGKLIRRSRSGYTAANNKGLVGIDLRAAYRYSGQVDLYTLPSQQIRKIGFPPFTDDDGSIHEYRIVYAHRAGIMERRTETRFAPGGRVTRARAALYLYRTIRMPDATRDYYDDDDDQPKVIRRAINALARAGISGGLKSREFDPKHSLTRGQAATFFKRALDLNVPDRDYFTDDGSSPHEDEINAMRRKGLMSGCAPEKFCPGREMTRGQMATLLARTVEAYR